MINMGKTSVIKIGKAAVTDKHGSASGVHMGMATSIDKQEKDLGSIHGKDLDNEIGKAPVINMRKARVTDIRIPELWACERPRR